MAFERLDTLLNLEMVSFGKNILPSIETLQEVITIISQKKGLWGRYLVAEISNSNF